MKKIRNKYFSFVIGLLIYAINCTPLAHSGTSPAIAEQPLPAESFASSVGINVHLNYFDRLYNNITLVKGKLRRLSIHHVRDGAQLISDDYDALMYGRWSELLQMGIKFNAALDPRGSVKSPTPSALKRVIIRANGSIESFEGPNEMDISSMPNWPSVVLSYQTELFTSLHETSSNLGKPAIAPSFAFVSNGLKANGLSTKADYANLHSYPAGEMPSHIFPEQMNISKQVFGDLPVVMTETGYHNAIQDKHDQPAVPEQIAAKYVPRLYLENFIHGVTRTYLYELLDEAPNPAMNDNQLHWGLVRADGTEKPAFRSLASLMSFIESDSNIISSNGSEEVTISSRSNQEHLHHLFLKKKDGSYCIFLWQEVSVYDTKTSRELNNPPQPVSISFSTPSSGSIRDILHPEPAVAAFTRKSQVTVSVPDYPVALIFRAAR